MASATLILIVAAHIIGISCSPQVEHLVASTNINGTTTPSEVISTILYKAHTLHGQITASQYVRLSLLVNTKLTPTSDRHIHSYANPRDLELSGGPKADEGQCLEQLGALVSRVELLEMEMGQSKDLNLVELLDTWGRQPGGMLLGNYLWPGSHSQCKRLQIKTSGRHLGTRYCIASLKLYSDWGDEVETGVSTGVCLPEACDSMRQKDKFRLIQQLAKSVHRFPQEANLTDLYCLPDEQSPLRRRSPQAKISLCLVGAWLALLIYSTSTNKYPSLSIWTNFKALFGRREATRSQVVDLECLNGLKVIATMFVISGHPMIFSESRLNNMRELASVSLQSMAHHWANMIPPLAVNMLFALSAIQLAYLSFRDAGSMPLLSRPKRWVGLIWNQYLRVMPYYALVVAYAKYLAKHTGSGPLWDYATSATSLRRSCEQESWWTTLTYGVIFKFPPEHCLPFAWYLANELIFLAATPILFSLLHWRPKLGQNVLIGSIVASFLLSSLKILGLRGVADLRPVTSFMPHGPRIVMTLLGDLYTLPHYRAAAYLAGLLIGYKLYQYEAQSKSVNQPPRWLRLAKEHGQSFVVFWFSVALAWPLIASSLGAGRNEKLAHRLLCFFYPFSHLMAALVIGTVVIIASTAAGRHKWIGDLLSAQLWRPLAKLCLPVTLISIEVVTYFTQTSQHLFYGDFKLVMSFSLSLIVTVYLLATLFHLLFEAPLTRLLNSLMLNVENEKMKEN